MTRHILQVPCDENVPIANKIFVAIRQQIT